MRIYMPNEALNCMQFLINKNDNSLNIIGIENSSRDTLPKSLQDNLINLQKNNSINLKTLKSINIDSKDLNLSINIEVNLDSLDEVVII